MKGVYVYFLNNKDITRTQEVIISIILKDVAKDGYCQLNNNEFSKILNLHKNSISRVISHLEIKKWIQLGYKNDNDRYIIPGEKAFYELFNIDNPNFLHIECLNKRSPKKRRVSLGKRFKVLNRDNFKCNYCGKKSESTKLEVDHIKPISKGGTNDLSNLTTSCWECNAGKSDMLINNIQCR